MSTQPTHDVIIIGSGPAGYTAAIYTARAELNPLVFEGTSLGGALMTTTEVENFPGFRNGIQGPELMEEMREQALRFGADLQMDDVESVSLAGPIKEVVTAGGDSAMEEATFLTKFARSVTIVHRREEFRASKIMLERARANDKIRFLTNTTVVAVDGDTTVTGLRVRNALTGQESTLAVTGVFIAVGHDPRSELVRGAVHLDSEGYVAVRGRTTATSVDGVFAAGDLVDHSYRQAITAAGSGCAAAIDAERWLADTRDTATTEMIGAHP